MQQKAKRIVGAEELRKLGVPEDLIKTAVELEKRGVFDVKPPTDLIEKTIEHVNSNITLCANRCTGKNLSTKKAWKHFVNCKICKDALKAELNKTK